MITCLTDIPEFYKPQQQEKSFVVLSLRVHLI